MPSRRKNLTGDARDRRLAAGFGSGEGAGYRPYLRVSDVPSIGTCSVIAGWKHGREHHLLSRNERNYFFCLEWSDSVLEIREQFPLLPLDETQRIARQLGIRHPNDRGEPLVMTTDFLLLIRAGNGERFVARTVKPAKQLEKRRVLEKFAIEKRYFEDRQTDWGLVTERKIPETVWRNVEWLHECRDLRNLKPIEIEEVTHILEQMSRQIAPKRSLRIDKFCASSDRELGLIPGTALKVFRHALATKKFAIDICVRLRTDVPIVVELRR
jgi:hypothetical protein